MSHLTPLQALAAGIHATPGMSGGFAATQAAWRFFSNPQVTPARLAQPLIDHVKRSVPEACDDYVLVPCDWSFLDYNCHANKADRISAGGGLGYDLFTALAIGDRDGRPLAPLCLELEGAAGVHTTRADTPIPRACPLDSLTAIMGHVEGVGLGRPAVFIVDREGDSVGHYRQWNADKRLFVVRVDDRSVDHDGQATTLSAVCEKLLKEGGFTHSRAIPWRDGKEATQHMAEASVTLAKPAKQCRKVNGKQVRKQVAGVPLTLRLIVSRVVDKNGKELSRWMLLTNVPASVDLAKVALWYYWRWRIESCFKLLKQAGQQVEEWQQESARAIAARLLVASMACTVVWSLARSEEPGAGEVRGLLVRLSGRQMKWKKGKGRVTHTEPALMAGLMVLLPMLELLETYTPEQLRRMVATVMPGIVNRTRGADV